MHPSVVGLPCRLVLMVAPPVSQLTNPVTAKRPEPLCPNPALPSWGRHLAPSRKALPFLPRSYGLMRQTFTLLPISVCPYSKGLCRLLPAPCCVKALPNAISVVLPYVPGPLLQLLPRCCLPFLPLGHWPSPSKHRVGAWRIPSLLLRMGGIFEAAVIPLRSGPQVCSPHR